MKLPGSAIRASPGAYNPIPSLLHRNIYPCGRNMLIPTSSVEIHFIDQFFEQQKALAEKTKKESDR